MSDESGVHPDKIFEFKKTFRLHSLKIIWKFIAGTSLDDEMPVFKNSYPSNKLSLRTIFSFFFQFHSYPTTDSQSYSI